MRYYRSETVKKQGLTFSFTLDTFKNLLACRLCMLKIKLGAGKFTYMEATVWTILKDHKTRKLQMQKLKVTPKRLFYLDILKVVYGLSEK